MILGKLLVNNFGVYAESKTLIYHQIKKPVILIGALNGSGKTTFYKLLILFLR